MEVLIWWFDLACIASKVKNKKNELVYPIFFVLVLTQTGFLSKYLQHAIPFGEKTLLTRSHKRHKFAIIWVKKQIYIII